MSVPMRTSQTSGMKTTAAVEVLPSVLADERVTCSSERKEGDVTHLHARFSILSPSFTRSLALVMTKNKFSRV